MLSCQVLLESVGPEGVKGDKKRETVPLRRYGPLRDPRKNWNEHTYLPLSFSLFIYLIFFFARQFKIFYLCIFIRFFFKFFINVFISIRT